MKNLTQEDTRPEVASSCNGSRVGQKVHNSRHSKCCLLKCHLQAFFAHSNAYLKELGCTGK